MHSSTNRHASRRSENASNPRNSSAEKNARTIKRSADIPKRSLKTHVCALKTRMTDKAKAVSAILLSAALILGLAPVVQGSTAGEPEAQAAQVAKVSFENKSKAEVEEMMRHMTIDEIVDAMPLRDKVSQMFITYTDDLNNATNGGSGLQAVNTTVKNNLATYPVGGVCYFRTNLTGGQAKSKKMSDDFQANNKYGMLIAVDEEGGAVQRIGGSNTQKYTTAGHSNPPGALTAFYRQWEAIPGVGVGTELLHMYAYENQGTGTAYSNAQSLAENCKLIGANWDFAPVADVDLKAGNAIAQAGRTYSKDVDLAADLTASAVKGFNDSGIACSAKHFPGHGSVAGDTHNGFVDQTKTLSELEATDLKVYKEILSDPDAELDSIMFGHMSTSNVEGASNIPASVSKYWVDYIRNELNFDGVVLTDGMRMDALKNFFGGTDDGYVQATVAAFDAGIDMFLLSGLPLTGIPTLESHITSDTTGAAMENLNDSVRRIMTLKRKYNIIPAYENDAEATYISSDGAMEHGTFAAMWSKASTQALQSGKPAPVVRLNKNVVANSSGSFGTGTNIADNGDLTLTANHSVTVDLNGFTLNKNLAGSSSADGKHIFNIPTNATVTIHDSSSTQDGKITGAGGDIGTVAYVTGSSAKFIVDSGNITGNTGTSLVYGDANAVIRFGIQDIAGNNAGPINITNNTSEYAVDFSGPMYLMGETVIKDNGGANLYFNGEGAIVNVQDRGLTGGKGSIGVTVSGTRAANADLFKPAGGITLTGNDLNALFYDDDTCQLELDTNIKLVKVDGDVRFTSSDGSISDTGTWDEMWNLSQTKDGTLTVLKDLNITYTTNSAADNKYVNKKNTTIQLNGKKLIVSSNNGRFINNEAGTLTISDRGIANKKEEQVAQASDDASFNRESRLLTYYEDRLNGSTLETYKVAEDLSAVGMISFSTTNKYAGNPEADGIIQNAGGTINLTDGVLTSEHARGITAKANTTVNMSGGYIVDCNSWGHASGIWAFGSNAIVNVSGGVIACNHAYGATSGSSGALGIYSGTAKAVTTGGLFTGNTAVKNGAAIGMASNGTTTSLSVSNTTICHNTSPDGAGIYANSASIVNIADSLISSNTSLTSGGGIYMNGSTAVNLSGNTVVMSNTAATLAGGIYNATSGKLSIKDSIVAKDNIANGAKSDIAVITNGNKISVNGALTSPSRSIGVDLPNAAPGNVFANGNEYTVTASDTGKFFIDSDETLFGSLDGNNNIYLEQGEAQYVSPDGNVENGDLKALWTKYFAAGTSGTITLMMDVTLSDDSQLVLETKASQAKLDLNGKDLVLANNRTDNESPIYIPSGSFEICDSSATASTAKTVVDVPAGTRAILSDDLDKLTYYTTEHEQSGIVTYKNDADLSAIGHIRYTGGSDPNGIVHVGASGTFTLTNGLLNCTNGRAILNGMATGTCTSKVNINGGYISGCKAGLASVLLARNGSITNINGGVIAGNTNPTGRGTVWMNSLGTNTLSMTGGVISGNYAKGGTAEQGGGAILVEYSNTSATITGGMITHNSTEANGGGICYATVAPANGLSISNVVISANKSGKNGGGIYSGRNIVDPNCHIDVNEASGQGGAIYTTAGLIANSLCTSENIAAQSAGIYAAGGITMKGKISIEDNVTSDGTASNLDIKHLPADKVQIVGVLESGSKIGLSIAKNSSERNQKVVSSTIELNDSYSDMFYDDADTSHVLRFNDGNDGLYLIQEDISGNELGSGPKMELGSSITLNGKNGAASVSGTAGEEVFALCGPGDGIKTTANYYTNNSNNGTTSGSTNKGWTRYFYTPVDVDENGNGIYELRQYYANDTVESQNLSLGKGEIYLIMWRANSNLSTTPGSKIYISNLDSRMSASFNEIQPNKALNLGTVQSVISEGTQTVDYKIHYIHHYPVSEVMTGEYYVEDQSRLVEATGVVGQLVYAPYDDIAGYLDTDSHNVISKTLQEDKAMGGPDWYYKDENFQGMHGSADSINDLYVIYEHPEEEYFYNVEYYDADTGQLIKTDEKLSASAFPIKATTSMKTLYEYEYDPDNANNIDTIESASDNMVLKLYFKKWSTYSIEYYDSDTGEQLDESIIKTYVSKPVDPKSEVPITIDTLHDSLKTIDGYDYVKTASTIDRIESIAQDGTSKMKLYFEKIIYRPYTIEYYDKDTGNLVGTLEKGDVKAGTKVTLPDINEEYAIASENVKYRIVPDDSRNVTEITIPRSGDVPAMKVYGKKVNTTRVHIQRYEYDGSKWTTMGLPVIIDCDSNTEFNVLTAENKTKYVDGISRYIFLPNDPKNVTQVHVGEITDPTPVVKLYYAKTEELTSGTGVQKTPNDNGLVPIERTSTKDFINIELFDFGNKVNSVTSNTGYNPIFKGYPLEGPGGGGTSIGNFGETIQTDITAAITGGDRNYNQGTSGYINRLGASSTDNKRPQGANAAINGLTYSYVGGRKTTASMNPMSSKIGEDGNPVLTQGNTSLGYLFPEEEIVLTDDQLATGDYLSRKVATGIDGLFDYDPNTGYYSYSSYKNHAEYNEETNKFDVYDVILTPNISDYQFGNFLPFTKINDQATPVTNVGSAYMLKVADYCRYKAEHTNETQLKKQYGYLASAIKEFDTTIKNKIGKKDYTYEDIYNYYFKNGGNPTSNGGTGLPPDSATAPQNAFIDPVTGNSIWQDAETFYDHMYMTDFDETKDFFFGITFDMNFVQPSKGTIGAERTPMQFHFEGDDDVLVYIDGNLFLNLAGIHRQVGGNIDFEKGIVNYKDYCYNTGKVSQASYPANSKYRDIDKGIVHFDEILRDSGYSEQEISDLLNENGTFKDWSQHNFKMFYLERGSGSGVMSIDFNLPVIPENTLIVSKEIAVDGSLPDDAEIISNPYFNFQLLRCNADGSLVRDINNNPVPYADENVEYLIYENGVYTGKRRNVDANGIITLKENQYAVITGLKHNDEYYRVRELIDKKFIEQYSSTLITGSDINGNNSENVLLGSTSTDPQNHIVIDGVEYIARTSKAIATGNVIDNPVTSTLFENRLDPQQLGSLAIYKSVVDQLWDGDADKDIYFAVSFDGKPVPMTTGSGTKMMYDVYNIDDISSLDADGKRVWAFEGATSTATPPRREVPATGIIALKANQVAVMRYMAAGSNYAVAEVTNPDANGLYHPIYKDGQTGQVAPKTFNTPVPIEVANQRAENLVISKQVENPSDTSAEFDFELTIDYNDEYVNGDYEYDIVSIGTDTSNAAELLPAGTVSSNFVDAAENGQWVTLADAMSGRQKLTFADGKASFKLKADSKIIIYGLPYQGTYSVAENNTDGYEVFNRTKEPAKFVNGVKTSTYVLDSKNTAADASNSVEFKNRKIEDLSVSKTVRVNPIDALIGNEDLLDATFDFSIDDATYNDVLLSGTYKAEIVNTYKKNDDNSDRVIEQEITFVDGHADLLLSHGQTITIHGLPYGTTYSVTEADSPNHETSYKAGEEGFGLLDSIVNTGTVGHTATVASPGLTEHQYVHFLNTVRFIELPGTGLLGLPIALGVFGVALVACWLLIASRHGKRGELRQGHHRMRMPRRK